MAKDKAGFTIQFIAVIKNGEDNVRFQRNGKPVKINPAHPDEAFRKASESATKELVEFFCGPEMKAPSHD